MGREARCVASWGALSGHVTVHLDASEIAVRGAFRARALRASLRDVRVAGETLHFFTGREPVALQLGKAAPRWATALVTPAPSLAAKLGVRSGTRIALDGALDDDALEEALRRAERGGPRTAPDLLIARVDDADALARILERRGDALSRGVPIWVVYTKGRAAPLGEAAVRDAMRSRGLVDVKIASVSASLTALQFVRRR